MEKYTITIVFLNTMTELQITVEAEDDEDSGDIILRTAMGSRVFTYRGSSYLEAYQQLRDGMLGFGYGIKCCGSCINAVQSGMMTYSPQVYLVTLGQQALKKDIVSIWEYCDISEFPDTKAQNEFTEKWFSSLKG